MSITDPLPDNILKCMDPKDRPKGNAGLTTDEAGAKEGQRLEKIEQGLFANWLNLNRLRYIHPSPVVKSTIQTGAPDFIVFFSREVLFFEFKALKGRFSPEQISFLTELILDGFNVFVPGSAGEAIEITKQWKNSLLAGQ